jgi:hypothetical protein
MAKPDAQREPIVEQCKTAALETVKARDGKESVERAPCPKITDGYCSVYASPAAKWRSGPCPFAMKENISESEKAVNPLKASKRASSTKKK